MKKLLLFIGASLLLHGTSMAQCAGAVGCPTIQMSGTSVACYGNSNGTAAVAEISGIGPSFLQYTWSNGATTNSISGLIAGTYSVSVKNTCTGCTATGVYTVNTPDPISVNSTNSNISCFGGNNGQIDLTVNGGVAPYSYSWNTGAVSADLTNQTAGTYNVVVTDAKGCSISYTTVLSQPTSGLGLAFSKIDVDCFGTATGSIDISPFGGTPPYAYSWSGVTAITQDVSNLIAQTYVVTITDNKACTYTQQVLITQPPLLTAVSNSTEVSCFGFSDGSVAVSASGGTTPYSYAWTNSNFVFSQNSPQLDNIPSDVYTAQITDAQGCSISRTENVGTPAPLSILSEIVTPVLCFGESTGAVVVTVVGGTAAAAYNYSWSNSAGIIAGQNSNSIVNFPADDYTVVITDDNGCILSKTYTIIQPDAPLSIITNELVDVLCFGDATGSIDISATGGTPGYTYSWENSANQIIGITEDKNSLVADVYTIIVTDASNCTQTETYTVDQPLAPLQAPSVVTPVVCFGESNGAININTSGGTVPYTYAWTNSTFQLSVQLEDLINYPSDTYSMVITDNNNCTFSGTYFIPEPPLLTGNLIGVDILCKNENTGSIDLNITGGVTPYNYVWSNGPITQDQNNLFTGNYSVIVTDANFCTFEDSIFLSEPNDTLGYSFTQVDVTCNSEANGSIDFTPLGGTPAYNINWSNTSTLFQVDTLTAGIYGFQLQDANGCIVIDSIEVYEPDVLLANEVVTWVTCHGLSDGIIDITPNGGNPPYNYSWYNSQFGLSAQSQDLNGFASDVYQLELRDSLNCLTELFIPLPQPDPLALKYVKSDVTCFGGSDGSIDLTVTGGNPAYTYAWSNSETTEDLDSLSIGNYQVIVVDTKNCTDSIAIQINQPDPITTDFEIASVSCQDQMDGSILAMPKGGTGTFLYAWSNEEETQLIENLLGGTYTVVVTDIVGCTDTASAFVPTLPISCIIPPSAYTPNGDFYNDIWFLKNIELYPEMKIQIFNKWGQIVHKSDNVYAEWDGVFHGQPLPADTYYYIIELNNQIEPVKGTVTIIR